MHGTVMQIKLHQGSARHPGQQVRSGRAHPAAPRARCPREGLQQGLAVPTGKRLSACPPLVLSGALPAPLLPDAWHTGHCQLGLPAAGRAPSLGAGAAAPSTRRSAEAPWHLFGSVESTWDAPAPAPARSGSEQRQSHAGGHRAEGGGQPPASPSRRPWAQKRVLW